MGNLQDNWPILKFQCFRKVALCVCPWRGKSSITRNIHMCVLTQFFLMSTPLSSSPGRTPRWEPSWVSELCNLVDGSSSPRWVGLYSFSDHEAISRLTRIGTCTHPDMEHTYRVGLVPLRYSVGYECWGGQHMWGKKGIESNSPATVGPLH